MILTITSPEVSLIVLKILAHEFDRRIA